MRRVTLPSSWPSRSSWPPAEAPPTTRPRRPPRRPAPLEEGVLTVATQLPAPPFWIGDDYETIEGGYEVDIANEIANRLDLDEVVFVEMPFDGLVAGADCPAT